MVSQLSQAKMCNASVQLHIKAGENEFIIFYLRSFTIVTVRLLVSKLTQAKYVTVVFNSK